MTLTTRSRWLARCARPRSPAPTPICSAGVRPVVDGTTARHFRMAFRPTMPLPMRLQWLRATSAAQWRMSVSALVEHVIRERRLLELAVVNRRPRDRWQRLRFLLDQARDFCDRGGRTLSEFLEWAKRQADEDTRVIESVVPESDNDAVRIMTIHAAKGLEFPVVVLTGLNVEPRDPPSAAYSGACRPSARVVLPEWSQNAWLRCPFINVRRASSAPNECA